MYSAFFAYVSILFYLLGYTTAFRRVRSFLLTACSAHLVALSRRQRSIYTICQRWTYVTHGWCVQQGFQRSYTHVQGQLSRPVNPSFGAIKTKHKPVYHDQRLFCCAEDHIIWCSCVSLGCTVYASTYCLRGVCTVSLHGSVYEAVFCPILPSFFLQIRPLSYFLRKRLSLVP